MSENNKTFRNGIIVALIGAIFGALVTIVGQPYMNQIFEEAKTPKLLKEYRQTNISSLPDAVRKQITLVTSRYTIRHVDGGTAERITISIDSDEGISASSIVIDPSSETATFREINENFKKIEIPAIRPKGQMSFEITHSPNNQIRVEEILKAGEIVDSEFEVMTSHNNKWWMNLFIGLLLTGIVSILTAVYFSLKKGANYIVIIEGTSGENISYETRSKIASVFSLAITYNFISYFGFINLSLPRIPIQDAFYALLIYVIIINYKKILTAIEKVQEK